MRLTIYLLFASVVSSSVAVLFDPTVRGDMPDALAGIGFIALYLFFIGGAGCLPGLAVWLVILNRLPSTWSRTKRRAGAVASAPLVGLFWFVTWLVIGEPLGAVVFGLLWPLGAGLVVRLREPFAAGAVTAQRA